MDNPPKRLAIETIRTAFHNLMSKTEGEKSYEFLCGECGEIGLFAYHAGYDAERIKRLAKSMTRQELYRKYMRLNKKTRGG